MNSIQYNDKYSEILMDLKRACENSLYWVSDALDFYPKYVEICDKNMNLIISGVFDSNQIKLIETINN